MARKRMRDIDVLGDMAGAFAESLNLEETLESILKTLDTHLRLQRGTITLFDPQSETIKTEVAHGVSKQSQKLGTYKVGEGITGMVVETGQEVVIPDIHKDPRFLSKTGQRPKSKDQRIAFFCVPIKLDGNTIGAISVDRKAKPGDDFESNVRLLEIISTMIAQAVKLDSLIQSDRRELTTENERLRRQLKGRFDMHNMIGTSNAMREVYSLIEQVANSKATVLIRGESGTGKDLVAHAVHYNSLRSEKPFVKINCTLAQPQPAHAANTPTYAGEWAGEYIAAALFSGVTLDNGGITIKPNVKFKQTISTFTNVDSIRGASCDFTDTADITLGEQVLEPLPFQQNMVLCKEQFQNDWGAVSMGYSAFDNLPPKFSDFLIAHSSAEVSEFIENKIWQGAVGADSFVGFVPLFQTAGSGVIETTLPIAITAANVIGEMGRLVDDIRPDLI